LGCKQANWLWSYQIINSYRNFIKVEFDSLTCPHQTSNINPVMNNTNYATQIVDNLKARGESDSYIVGFLEATINAMYYLTDRKEWQKYIENTIKQSK
jgi:hypothetical protein